MSRVDPTIIISHWYNRADGLQQSSDGFYREVEKALSEHKIEHIKVERVNWSEGSIFSSKREYLQIRRGEHVFHICAAPFGNGFFISWWLGHVQSGFLAWCARLPIIGLLVSRFLTRLTHYKIDTALMFQSVTHSVVAGILDEMLNAKGMRALSDTERAPIMRDFFAQIGGT
jgi:hypothetical protein